MPSSLSSILRRLHAKADSKDAAFLRTFFKTAPGQYGAGDLFIGVRVPAIRNLLPHSDGLSLGETETMLQSPIHEERLLALLILVRRFQHGDEKSRRALFDLYLKNTGKINNWDLVDQSSYHIVGAWLLPRSRKVLKKLAGSALLWERRIAVVSTYAFIRHGDFVDTLLLCRLLLADQEDLMHKACGWMLREVGKRDERTLCHFLDGHAASMPRTMLRYAIERFPEVKRKAYLSCRPFKKR